MGDHMVDRACDPALAGCPLSRTHPPSSSPDFMSYSSTSSAPSAGRGRLIACSHREEVLSTWRQHMPVPWHYFGNASLCCSPSKVVCTLRLPPDTMAVVFPPSLNMVNDDPPPKVRAEQSQTRNSKVEEKKMLSI